ncbi:MAG: hypothetical protein KJN62_08725 [Deltaproteobacteria bacterium]|nr:hypothetical protein [Deltaproteobacteria bacterium]
MNIKIQGIPFEINYIESNLRDDERMGRVDCKLCKINICEEMPEEMKFSTLIHEIVEAINDLNELGMKHNVISSLSMSLSEVLLDNDITRLP